MRRYRTFNSGRHRSLASLANQPRRRPPLEHRTGFGKRGTALKQTTWTPNAACEAKRGERCRLCGTAGGELHLHHLIPRSLSRAGRDDPDNLIGLCFSCHDGFHQGTPIPRSILTMREWEAMERYAPSLGWLARRYPRKATP